MIGLCYTATLPTACSGFGIIYVVSKVANAINGKLMTAVSPFRLKENPPLNWQRAAWDDYVRVRDYHRDSETPRVKLFFFKNALLVDDMGREGINHAIVRGLFAYIFLVWFSQRSQQAISIDGCLFEKDGKGAGSPDLVIYTGSDYPQWQPGETRKIDLDRWRSPDLVGEISDTTLASDLDRKKQLYAALEIAEYWVIDVRAQRIFSFRLDQIGEYQEVSESGTLTGLGKSLLEETLAQLETMTNMEAANWFQQQISHSIEDT